MWWVLAYIFGLGFLLGQVVATRRATHVLHEINEQLKRIVESYAELDYVFGGEREPRPIKRPN